MKDDNTITFFSSKYNVIALYVLCYLLLGLMLGQYLTVVQMVMCLILMLIGNFVSYLMGMNKGIIMTVLNGDRMMKLFEIMYDDDSETNDEN